MILQYDNNLEALTPDMAIELLKVGNERFVNNISVNRNLLAKVSETEHEQKPFAAIVSCMDSRAPVELLFDQGIGDIFSIRLAGNVVSENVLGSLEYAVGVTGSKLIVVMGHTNCGAIKGACDNVQLGNLTSLLEKIQVSVEKEDTITSQRNGSNKDFVNRVALLNVYHSVSEIVDRSSIIRHAFEQGKIKIVAAMYCVSRGVVEMNEIIPIEGHQHRPHHEMIIVD